MNETFGGAHREDIDRFSHSEARSFRARNPLFRCRRQADSSPIRLASE